MEVSGHCSALAELFPGLSAHLREGWVGSCLDALVILKITASVGNQILISWLSSPGPGHFTNCTKFCIGPLYSMSSVIKGPLSDLVGPFSVGFLTYICVYQVYQKVDFLDNS
jgi:hypothetical protein